MRVLLLPLVCALTLGTLAGCVSDAGETPAPAVQTLHVTDVPTTTTNLLDPTISVPVQSTKVSNGAEPRVYVSKDNSVLWIGDSSGGYRSFDGGDTWSSMSNPMLQGFIIDGWDFGEDDNGILYGTSTNGPNIQVFRSANNGLSWDIVTRFTADAVSGIADRPWIDARGDGELVLIFNDTGFTTRCQKSYDGGITWPDVYPTAGIPISGSVVFDENGWAFYSSTAGDLYFIRTTALPADTSCFSGFSVRQISHTPIGRTLQSQTDVDGGVAYTAYPSENSDGSKVSAWDYMNNVGKEFHFGLPNLKSNTFQTIAAEDGRIYVAWYGSEDDGDFGTPSFSGWWDVYLAVIDDFWSANPSVQIYTVQEDNHKGMICLGGISCDGGNADRDLLDYFGIDAGPDGRVHIAYGHDGATSNAEVRYAGMGPFP